MQIHNPTAAKLQQNCKNLDTYIKDNYKMEWVKYLDLGTQVVKLINYSKEFTPLVEKQLTYSLKDSSDKFDATIVIWKENNIKMLPAKIDEQHCNPKINLKLRVEMLVAKKTFIDLQVLDDNYSLCRPLIDVNPFEGIINAFDQKTNTYYYGVEDLEPEEFIKKGHIFVQTLNCILKTETTALVHGAVVGLDNQGILFCARGQRGKSTLAVLSMLKGLDYVSDDYLTLSKEGDGLYSYPIYSIITLSPRMYNELYDELDGKFVSNNARKDKYVINIAKYHNQFKAKYPIKVCIFPEIVCDDKPSIKPCPKGRAIAQLIHSTVMQMQDISDNHTIKKLLDMVKDFDFYKLNLCSDISANTEYLRDFLVNFDKRERQTFVEDKMFEDITFDLANILNSETGILYSMNKFATNIYENLKLWVSKEAIIEKLLNIQGMPSDIDLSVNAFVEILKDKEILKNEETNNNNVAININEDFIVEDNYRISLIEYKCENSIELVEEIKQEKLKNGELCIKR